MADRKVDYNRNTRRYEERDSSKAGRTGASANAAAATLGTTSTAGAGLGTAAKRRPKLPKRADFAGDKEYQVAYQAYLKERDGDVDAVAQKRALGRMK